MLSGPDLPELPWLDQLNTPVMVLNFQGWIRYANPAAASWLGVSPRRLLETEIADLPPDGARLAEGLARLSQGSGPVEVKGITLAFDPDSEQYADAVLSAAVDGTAELVLVEFHPRQEFPGSDPAQKLPQALSATLRGLAHELKNPLAGLRGAAQLLARQPEPQTRRYAEVILSEADRLLALTEAMLSPGPSRPHVPVNLHAVLEQVRVLAESEAEWSAVIQRDYDPSLPEFQGDPDRLIQATWNLVRNALQAGATSVRLRTRAEHQVRLGTEEECRLALRLDVIDDGAGVPEDLAERIFLPLVSGRAEGTGLGLALAQSVAREHGGLLSYRSRPGHTVFTLLLPAASAQAGG
jgi:two-component system nitrogen regulation sensor histidine kinase GlnL